MTSRSTASLRLAITYPYALGTHSGGSQALFEIARGLARRGVEVVVLPVASAGWTRFPRHRVPDELMGAERRRALDEAGVEVIDVRPNLLSQWLDWWEIRRAVGRLQRRRPLDAVLGFHHEAGGLPGLAARHSLRFGMVALWQTYRFVATSGPSRPERLAWLANRHVVIEPLRRSDRLFATSEFTRRELIDVVGVDADRISICWLGVDPSFAAIPRRRVERVRRLMFFGRLVPEKGCFDALEALATLTERGKTEWTFRMMGSGDPVAVERRAEALGIGEQVVVMPFKEREQLQRELEWADLALMPSHAESFGLSIAEAQAAGLAVVAYAAGSVPEIVEDGVSGWLAPPGDVARLSDLLGRAMNEPEEVTAAGLAGRERVASRFTWEKTCDRILAGLEELGPYRSGGSR